MFEQVKRVPQHSGTTKAPIVPPQVNNDEIAAMKLLATAEPTFHRLLTGIWSTSIKSMTSVPLDLLTSPFLLTSTPLPVTQKDNPKWYDILTVTPAKQTFWLRRVDGKFQYALEACQRARKQVKLTEAFKDKNTEMVWRVACCFFCAMQALPDVLTSEFWSEKRQNFLKGHLDSDFKDKCACLDPNFDFAEIRFIRMAKSAMQGENPEVMIQRAEREALMSEFLLARAKLLGEQRAWEDYKAKKKAIEEAGQTEFNQALMAANEALDDAVTTHMKSNYMAVSEPDITKMWSTAEAHLQTFVEHLGSAGTSDLSSVYRVDIYNLAALGPRHGSVFQNMVEQASIDHAANPKTSVSLFFLPNCPAAAQAGGAELAPAAFAEQTKQAVDDVLAFLKNKGITKMMVKEVVAIFKDTHSGRPKRADFVMCISDARDPSGTLVSEFVSSTLWRFEAVSNSVPMLLPSEYKDWTQELSVAGGDSDVVSVRRQWLSGEGFYKEIVSALFDGVSAGLGSIGHVREYSLYDDTLGKAVLKLNASRNKGMPLLGWCGLTTNNWFDKAGAGSVVQSNVAAGLCDEIRAMVKNRTYTIPGFTPIAIQTSSTSTPLPLPTFVLCCPKDNHLPVRQTVVDELMDKAKTLAGDAMEKLKSWIAAHNKEVNPSGKNWTTTSGGTKRPPEVATADMPEARAVVIDPRQGQPTTMEELRHPSRGKTRELACGDYSLIASKDELWLLANQDTVVSDLAPLLQVRGKYEIDAVAQETMANKAHWLNFSVTAQTLVTCEITGLPQDKQHDVPTSPLPLNSLLAKLEVLGYPKIKLRVHTVSSPRLSHTASNPHKPEQTQAAQQVSLRSSQMVQRA